MSINFTTLQSLTIPEGKVKQITDASGRVIWGRTEPVTSDPVILEVEKITSNTYAGETLYENEQFILLNIYPKTANSTIDVTYGGLTKTLTFTGTNGKQVFFGTFNGVSDEVTTPESGVLTIEGDCRGFGQDTYNQSSNKNALSRCRCIRTVTNWGGITFIPNYAFDASIALDAEGYITFAPLPDRLTSIGSYAFYKCSNLTLTSLPNSLTSIGDRAFSYCSRLNITEIPDGVTSIGSYAFSGCDGITAITIPSGVTFIGESPFLTVALNDINGGSSDYLVVNDCVIEKSTKTLIFGCAKSIIPLDGSVEIIGISAFSNGKFPADVTIPASVTAIKSHAFMGLQISTSPGYVQNLTILATTPPTLGTSVFGNPSYGTWAKTFTITVPKGCGDTYKAADGWSKYADYIVEAS